MTNKRLHTASMFAFGAVFAALMLFSLYNFSTRSVIETNILALLPQNNDSALLRHVDQKISSNFEKKIIILIKHSQAEKAAEAARQMEGALIETDLFSSLSGKIGSGQIDRILGFYQSHSASLLTPQQQGWLENNDIKALRTHMLSKTYGLGGDMALHNPDHDPLFFFSDAVNQTLLREDMPRELIHDVPVIKGDQAYYSALYAEIAGNPFSLTDQQSILEALEKAEQAAMSGDPELEIIHSGLIFHAANGADSAKSEISQMGTLSLLGVLLLLVFTFKSIRPFLFVFISIIGGGAAGFAVCLIFFEKIHILTLVFGTSLVGISVDYALHFLAERYGKDVWDAQKAVMRIFSGITLGLITSIVGFLGLCLTPIPILQQMAVFSIGGLIFVYGCVVFFYPVIFKVIKYEPNALLLIWVQKWITLCQHFYHPAARRILILLALCLIIVAFFLPGRDDIRAMQTLSPTLLSHDKLVAEILGAPLSGQMFVVSGKNEEEMLSTMERVSDALDNLQQQGSLIGYSAISQFAASQAKQRDTLALLQKFLKTHEMPLREILSGSGMGSERYDTYLAYLEAQSHTLYTLNDFLNSVNLPELNMLYSADYHDGVLGYILLKHHGDISAFESIAAQNPQVFFLDKVTSLSSSLDMYRHWASIFALAAFVVIYALVMVRYGAQRGVNIILPSLLAALLTLCLVTLVNGSYSLFHVLSLFLVIGIGVDYALFITESHKDKNHGHRDRAMLAIVLSALTTLLSFGLLATSATSALHDFGFATIFGITTTFLFSSMLLFERK